MASNFPSSLDAFSTGHTNVTVMATTHPNLHNDIGDAINKIEAKVGIGASTAVADRVLAGTGTGTSAWSASPTLGGLTLTGAGGTINYGIDLNGSSFAVASIRLKNAGKIVGRNNADAADVNMLQLNASDKLEFMTDVVLADGFDIGVGTTNGTQFGTTSSQKIAFWGGAPVAQGSAWTITNGTIDRTFNANLTSLDELADAVYTMWFDLNRLNVLP
jgi:hypothetical protein